MTALLLGTAVASFAYRARNRHGYGPALLGVFAGGVTLAGKFAVSSMPLWYSGLVLFLGAAVWNAWPGRGSTADRTCASCAAQDRRSLEQAHKLEA